MLKISIRANLGNNNNNPHNIIYRRNPIASKGIPDLNNSASNYRNSFRGPTSKHQQQHNVSNHDWAEGGECTTPACMQAAARLLHRLDPSHEPCEDFYKFSCGNFIARNEIPDDSFQRSTLQEMQQGILIDIKSKLSHLSYALVVYGKREVCDLAHFIFSGVYTLPCLV
ncbi:Membrane metallo-endopeptidase-like 1 [Orchesella cincta]|uniref:Membrane metallo-endopeptidase-like 1 n=1 Tax=Orchesella cincta TaxID=48709 RepID=A0A1D2MVP4_ORCCI|nr:Membrane metallo-endopeptidase-like 1 [Orchesella cincta]